jgi:hypothetical protein
MLGQKCSLPWDGAIYQSKIGDNSIHFLLGGAEEEATQGTRNGARPIITNESAP